MANTLREKNMQSIGEYRVLEQLAKTEMASIYRGLDPATGNHVAIKVASPVLASKPVLLKRFSQEFTLIKGLKHPHLIRALRYGHHDDVPYMVLEYVDGMSLGDRIEREGRLSEAEGVRIITQVGKALHYAHQKHIIHRDVKPDNILLTAVGLAKLADLGLAKDCESEEMLTRARSGLGTPNFMAPEQFTDAKYADWRCDVYSLGATLYMAVTGVTPFRGKGPLGVMKKKLKKDLTPPRQLVPDISPRTEHVILRAVDVNPRARHPSCQDFINELTGQSTEGMSVAVEAPVVSNGSERRVTVRYPASKGGMCQPLRAGEDDHWELALRDISADGIGLVLPRRFEPRTVLVLELLATEDEPAQRLLVRVVRVTEHPGRCWFHGCVFASRLGDEEVDALR